LIEWKGTQAKEEASSQKQDGQQCSPLVCGFLGEGKYLVQQAIDQIAQCLKKALCFLA
jgi:hypothetical protein